MSAQANAPQGRFELAIQACQDKIKWYERAKFRHRLSYQVLATIAILLGALTPVLILWTDLKLIQALSAATAAIAIGLNNQFQWRDSYIRFAYTSEMLKSELLLFQTRTSPAYQAGLGDQQILDNFITRMESIAINEVTQWRNQLLSAPKLPDGSK